jgi:hypothetical protein
MPPVRHVRARRSVQIPIDQRYPPGCRGLVTSAMSVLFTAFGVSHRFSKRLAEGQFSGQLGSHLTHRWREMESNLRFPNRSAPPFSMIGLTVSRPGTEGSTPFPSSGESGANFFACGTSRRTSESEAIPQHAVVKLPVAYAETGTSGTGRTGRHALWPPVTQIYCGLPGTSATGIWRCRSRG